METDFLQVTESDSVQVTDITQFLSELLNITSTKDRLVTMKG